MSYAARFVYLAGDDRDARVPAELVPFVVEVEANGPAHVIADDTGTPMIRRLPGRVFFVDTSVAIFGAHGTWYAAMPNWLRRSAL